MNFIIVRKNEACFLRTEEKTATDSLIMLWGIDIPFAGK